MRKKNTPLQVIGLCMIWGMSVSASIGFLWMMTGIIKMLFQYLAIDTFPLKMLAIAVVSLIIFACTAITYLFIAAVFFKFRLMSMQSRYAVRDCRVENRAIANSIKMLSEEEGNNYYQYEYTPSGASDIDMPVYNYLINDIAYLECALITGESRSGKTTLIQHMIKQKGEMYGNNLVKIILDPDNKSGKWGDIDAIGGGGDYRIIENAIDKIVEIFEVRSKLFYLCDGEDTINPKILIVLDEFHILKDKIANVWDKLMDIFTRGRKHSMYLYIISNGVTAESIGLKGRMDLMHNFEATIKTYRVNDNRRVEVKTSRETKEYEHCGKYVAGELIPIDKLIVHSQPKHKAKDEEERKLISSLCKPIVVYDKSGKDMVVSKDVVMKHYNELMAIDDFSWNKLCKVVYGYSNGVKVIELKEILGVDESTINSTF